MARRESFELCERGDVKRVVVRCVHGLWVRVCLEGWAAEVVKAAVMRAGVDLRGAVRVRRHVMRGVRRVAIVGEMELRVCLTAGERSAEVRALRRAR